MRLRVLVLTLLTLLVNASANAVVDGSCNFTAGSGTAAGFRGCNEEFTQRAPSIVSVAAVRALTTATLPSTHTTISLLSWHVGLRFGGGLFQYDSTDTTSADDGGVVLVDASSRRWKRLLGDASLTPQMFGAKADGVYDGGLSGFNGTDDTQAFANALAFSNTNGKTLHVPAGNYRFARKTTYTDTYSLPFPNAGNWTIEGEGYDKSIFLMDELVTQDQPSNGLIGGNPTSGSLHITGIGFQGLWTQHPVTGALPGTNRGGAFLQLGAINNLSLNMTDVTVDKSAFRDSRWNAISIRKAKTVRITDSIIERNASGGFNVRDSERVIITGNKIDDSDDDALSIHTNQVIGEGAPIRSRVLIANNIITNSEGIVALGAHTTIVANNILSLTHGSGLTIGNYTTIEGSGSQGVTIVHGNILRDTLNRYDDAAWQATAIQNGVISVGGSIISSNTGPTDFPDAWDGASYQPPYAKMDAAAPWGAMNVIDWFNEGADATIYANAGARYISVNNNQVVRTLPNATLFSDWGYGQYFSRAGYVNPAVTDAAWRTTALSLWSDMVNFSVTDNLLSGYPAAGIYLFQSPDSIIGDQEFRDGLIANNQIIDCGQGITTSNRTNNSAPPYKSWSLTIEHNLLDLDPFHRHTLRISPLDGTWTSSADLAARPDGINLRAITGAIVRSNIFRNLYTPLTANTDIYSQHTIEDNTVDGQPVSDVYNTANKGVAVPEPAGPGFRHRIYDSNPTSATYRGLLNLSPLNAAARPTSGTFVKGDFVRNTGLGLTGDLHLYGWLRVTTGSAHVLNTDWREIWDVAVLPGGTTNFIRADGTFAAPPGGGGGDSVTINGVAAVDVDLDDALPAAPSSEFVNVRWQKDASSPANVSGYTDLIIPNAVGGITAFAGGGQASATQLNGLNTVNTVTTVATSGDSVKLPASATGARVWVVNEGANSLNLFPTTGGTIDLGATNASVVIPTGVSWMFIAQDASNNWGAASRSFLFSATVPSALGSATAGTSNNLSRRDHVHPSADLATAQVTGLLPVANGGHGAAPGADDQVFVSSSISAGAWAALPDSEAAGTILGYDVATNAFSTKTDDDVPEVGDFAALVGGTGIDNTSGTLDFDATELGSFVWGSGASFFSWTMNAGATDTVLTFTSPAATSFSGEGTSPRVFLDDNGSLLFREEDAGGTNYVEFKAAAAITTNQTCTFENDASFIPDSCVGDGTDAGGSTPFTRVSGSSGAAGADVTLQTLTANCAANATTTPAVCMTTTGVGAGVWNFKYTIRYQSSATTTGVGFNVNHSGTTGAFVSNWTFVSTGTTATTGIADQVQAANAGTDVEGKAERAKNTTSSSSAGVDTLNADMLAIVEGLIVVTVSGSLELKHNSETANSTQVMDDTHLILTKME